MLVGAAALSLAVVGPVAWSLAGGNGLAGAIASCGVCTLAASIALGLGLFISSEQAPRLHLGFGLFVRMALPLAFALVVIDTSPALVHAGTLYSLVLFYLVTLAVETVLTLPESTLPKSSLSKTDSLSRTGAPTHG